ncbi:MAG: MucR family transcriptional regulator [Parafilimonas terrae]|nr:MucR family transcriptional regulator [Parafilimonas terrae]
MGGFRGSPLLTDRKAPTQLDLISSASEIVAAYVSHNHVAHGDVPAVIASVHACLTRLASGATGVAEVSPDRLSAAQIRRSVQHDRIISFIDGRSYKTLKRHLTAHGLTPDSYRERFGLPGDYPMVAPSYSERRSSLAKKFGLGSSSGGEGVGTGRRRAS